MNEQRASIPQPLQSLPVCSILHGKESRPEENKLTYLIMQIQVDEMDESKVHKKGMRKNKNRVDKTDESRRTGKGMGKKQIRVDEMDESETDESRSTREGNAEEAEPSRREVRRKGKQRLRRAVVH
eukprot:CAMPEP_0168189032 /NCGR_PEP_ID=MMETSP0139_2-20121125/16095_1 /TAXON_ID=44445 /ORGANISM="Pseudo-nitzschia australis, Strain 10249 10 AB" /LENGTH=125 /DNA_ID=CAMNT_0008111771 /DNA_START=580 /DNA_END=958 /DNA_ORIENTATION=+